MDNLQKIKNFIFRPKMLFIVLGVVILLEVIYAAKVLTSPASVSTSGARRAETVFSKGRISLESVKINYLIGETVTVNVSVDSGGRSLEGTDVIVHFDPKVLEATSGGLVKGKIFDEYPLLSLDNKKGLISISGIGSFKGRGQFASVDFKAKTAGSTSVVIDYQKGSTADSNLVEAGTSKDILESVENLNLDIQ